MVKNQFANAGDARDTGSSWSFKTPWRRAWQPTSILAWRTPWTEESGGL